MEQTLSKSESAMQDQPLQLKGSRLSVFVLEVASENIDEVAVGLRNKVVQAPQLFESAPLIIFSKLDHLNMPLLEATVSLCREHRLTPILIQLCIETNITDVAGVAVMSAEHTVVRPIADLEVKPAPQPKPITKAMIIDKPVRSGQQIYAKDQDLIIMSSVSEGAEVIADGDIHVHGALRGRAIAGASGDESARIFCTELRAQLVSIAGVYKLQDAYPEAGNGFGACVSLDKNQLQINGI